MKLLPVVLAVLAMLITAGATLIAVVFCLGMGANASPAQIRLLKFWMLAFALLGLGGIAGGIYFLNAGQAGWAAGISIVPAVIMTVVLVVALLT